MNNYIVRNGESISDVALNACGSINAWSDILLLNNLNDWNPTLIPGQSLNVPNVIEPVLWKELQLYPACNTSVSNKDVLINSFVSLLNDVTDIWHYLTPAIRAVNIEKYIVKQGETITDVVINSTGSIQNWESIIDSNQFNTWTPVLTTGQEIIITYLEKQTNVLKDLQISPACNSVEITDLDEQISLLISKFTPPSKEFEDGESFEFEDGETYKFENA